MSREYTARAADVHLAGPGQVWPLGVSVLENAPADALRLNLAVWAPDAEAVECCLFDAEGQEETRRLTLDACTDGVWHAAIDLRSSVPAEAELVYGWRVHGPWQPERGHRFNPAKVLLDPWAQEVVGRYAGDLSLFQGHQSERPEEPCHRDNAAVALKARWRASRDPAFRPDPTRLPQRRVPWSETVLYEAHVRGLTRRHPDIPAELRGRYAALAHPVMLAHYRRLGITTLSLLPVHARTDEARLQGLGLTNYWGYSSIGFLAPEPRYGDPSGQIDAASEFRTAVAALQAAGFEVVLDVVYNHSAETDENGPTLSLRGLANARYYRLRKEDPQFYENWTGCGNCLDLTQPRVLELVLASLRHWVTDYGVDGFRFDLAPVLARDRRGDFDPHAAWLAALQADPVLSRVKWIAEPWDIGPGGYQLGAFPPGWHEWNDGYRDDLREWWLGRHAGGAGTTRGALAHRLAGSSAQFHHNGRQADASVNFLTAHDGFTLRDLLSYAHKHNHANGEHNRDGHGHNRGWNGGVEGPSTDPVVHGRRLRLSRALLGSLLLSQGTPMLLAGDELGHSQGGNNNAYCQDNETTWLDWQGPDADDLCETVARLTRLRRTHAPIGRPQWLTGEGDVRWLSADGALLSEDAQWHGSDATLMVHLMSGGQREQVVLLFNAAAHDVAFVLPRLHGAAWRCDFDSAHAGGVPDARDQTDSEGVTVLAHGLQVWSIMHEEA